MSLCPGEQVSLPLHRTRPHGSWAQQEQDFTRFQGIGRGPGADKQALRGSDLPEIQSRVCFHSIWMMNP